ncbi:MAG TPA: HPP family protein, partial [Flavobacterium sp.]|nr:HPP family protein [Flavobacterium sp.]
MPTTKIKRSYRKTRYILYKETLIDFKEHFWSFLGSFVGIGLIAFSQSQQFSQQDVIYLIGSFGASSVLVYGIID